MKKTFRVLFVTMAAGLLMMSCKKQTDYLPENDRSGDARFRSSVECEDCCISGTETVDIIGSMAGMVGGVYQDFVPLYLDLCTGETSEDSSGSAQLRLHSYYNSHITGVNGWKLAYLGDTSCSCVDSYSCSYIRSNYQTLNIENNTLGRNNVPGSSAVGWFDYQVPGLFKKVRCIVTWQDCNNNDVMDAGEAAYVLCVTNAVPRSSGGFHYADVTLSYKCCSGL
jgi:hypothetical protein